MADPATPPTQQPKFQFKMKMDMGQFLAKMEEGATFIKNKRPKGGLRGNRSKDSLTDYELSKLSLKKNLAPDEPKISPEDFAAILEKQSHLQEFDILTNLLSSIPDDCPPELVDKMVKENQEVLNVVNYRLFELISTESFMQGVVQIGDIGSNLESSMVLAKNGRRVVQSAMASFSSVCAVFQMLKRRHEMNKVTQDLECLQRMLAAHEQLQVAHRRGDFPEAVRLFLICVENMQTCSPVAVVDELALILQETYTQIQDRLDKALVDCCRNFNPQTYEKVFNAYKILGKSNRILEKIQASFVNPIEAETRNIVLAHVLMSPNNMERAEQCKNVMKFKELCSALTYDHYVNCLLTILEFLYEVMVSHYTMKKWHQDKQFVRGDEYKYFADVVAEMDRFKRIMWDNMQRQVSTIFGSPNLSSYKLDDFLKVLDGVVQFVDIGEGFGSSMASNLRNTITAQSKAYFEAFHKNRAEELRTILTNELWLRCPVSPNFTVMDVKEFGSIVSGPLMQRKSSTASTAPNNPEAKFIGTLTSGNPFSKMIQYQRKNAIASPTPESDSDEEEELRADAIDEDEAPNAPRKNKPAEVTDGPVLTSTTINVIKILGKYLYMLKVLQPIALEVFMGITQVFQYYMCTVYSFFGAPPPITQASGGNLQQQFTNQLIGGLSEAQKLMGFSDDQSIPPKLKATIQKLKEKFATDKFNPVSRTASSLSNALQQLDSKNDEITKTKWVLPKAPNLELNNSKTNYGLAYRIVGIESLSFLVAAIQEAKQFIQIRLPSTATDIFQAFYNDDVAAAEQFKAYAYKTNVAALLNTSQFIEWVLAYKWDSADVPTKANPYVEQIFKEYQQFGRKLDEASKISNFPTNVKNALWVGAIVRGTEQLVEAYSRIKKCSNEGRVVMLQDVDVLRSKLEKLTPLRPIPNIGYVETYVKAFYQLLLDPNADVVMWYKQHPEYTSNQVISLINLGVALNVFAPSRKQTIVTAIKELERK